MSAIGSAGVRPAAPATRAHSRLTRLAPWWPLAAITLLAAALRLATLDLQSFWYDEAFTPVHVLHPSLLSTLRSVSHTENTPPLWYLLAWADSRVLGTGEIALRLPSALAGIATVPVAWAIGRELADRRAAIVCATLVAVNPLLVWYSQEARAYGLFVLMAALAMLCFVRAEREPTAGRMGAFALTGVAGAAYPLFRRIPADPDGAVAGVGSAHPPALATGCWRAGDRRRRAAGADLSAGGARHAVDRALGALGAAAGDPAVLPDGLLRLAARPRRRAARRAADPRRPRARAVADARAGTARLRLRAPRRGRRARQTRLPPGQPSGCPRPDRAPARPVDGADDRRRRNPDPDRAGGPRRRLPRAAQPRRGDDPADSA